MGKFSYFDIDFFENKHKIGNWNGEVDLDRETFLYNCDTLFYI